MIATGTDRPALRVSIKKHSKWSECVELFNTTVSSNPGAEARTLGARRPSSSPANGDLKPAF
jgi:hypothetical protein